MSSEKNQLLMVSKFAAIIFLADEYYQHSKDLLLRLKRGEGEGVLNNSDLNRSQKKKLEKMISEDMEKYKKRINAVGNLLHNLSMEFCDSKDEAHNKIHDFSVDLLQRALDKFTVTEGGEILEDKVKDHIFESLDRIQVKERTIEEVTRIKSAFDNFMIKERII